MATGFAGGEMISERLHESLARLREDIERVEMWAGALEGFSQPIPDYDAARRYRLSPGDDAPDANAATRKAEDAAEKNAVRAPTRNGGRDTA